MAKDTRALINTNLFAKTEPEPTETKPEEKPKNNPRGVFLKIDEWAELEKIATDLDLKPHALRSYAIRYFISQYKAGKIQTKTQTQKTLPEI